ncbi:MAG TPA: PP2C family protein-serine/threonine phosphatase, partial [Solirubrobacteraceae bacterium]|nr:PP2C family protein-serine/threonine phosphatase [Solirubrobacteraceae bacterium]
SLVGGDFYDVWPVAGDWMVVIGDVTGKGIEAAALTALVRHTLRAASEFDRSPARLLALVDATLKKRPALSVCTALCMRVHGRRVTLAVGGHPLPLLLDGEEVRALGEHGPLLGAFSRVRWRDLTLELAPGSTLVAYTDGITDARGGARERFGFVRLRDTLRRLADKPLGEAMDTLARELERFQTGSHTDDTAAIALRLLDPDAAQISAGGTREAAQAGALTTHA